LAIPLTSTVSSLIRINEGGGVPPGWACIDVENKTQQGAKTTRRQDMQRVGEERMTQLTLENSDESEESHRQMRNEMTHIIDEITIIA
jgi:hypothetical protein